jgi:hypothetical protein
LQFRNNQKNFTFKLNSFRNVLVLERWQLTEPIFDDEQLDVYRLAIRYVASSCGIAKS